MSVKNKIRVNMTLCFSQEQAAAVYAATKGSREPLYAPLFTTGLAACTASTPSWTTSSTESCQTPD